MTKPTGITGHQLLPGLLELAGRSPDEQAFLEQVLPRVIQETGGGLRLALIQGIKGAWREIATEGTVEAAPTELLAEVLDQESAIASGSWAATPVSGSLPGLLLVARSTEAADAAVCAGIGEAIAACLPLVRRAGEATRRAEQLSEMLDMTVAWNQSRQTDDLLLRMAETSTRLLDAQRATIFLLEPGGNRLIGRPALGIEEGQLIIEAGTGVAGQVVQTGQPRRIDADIADEQAEIDRTVDAAQGFQTRSLLCVPVRNGAGQTIGAFQLLNKNRGNFSQADEQALSELAAHAAVAIENTRHVEDLNTARQSIADEAAGRIRMIGDSPQVDSLRETAAKVAATELAVLILGENGTGKEVTAQTIHYLSPRRDHVLVAVNCAALTESLLESELFGHERGAFTDAHETRPGKFEAAHGGTLFLDEIGDMSPGGQAKLLRVLEEKVVVRVGGSRPIPVDTRVIAATNQDLARLVVEKKFREDLFFRLNVVTLQLPPLRERGDDILMLAEHFLAEFCARARRPVPRLMASARKKLVGHGWPGNIRELRNMMERLAYLSTEDRIDAGDLSFVSSPTRANEPVSLDQTLADATRQFQSDYIERHIKRARGNMTDAAERLGLHRSNLYRKMKQLGMDSDEEPAGEADTPAAGEERGEEGA